MIPPRERARLLLRELLKLAALVVAAVVAGVALGLAFAQLTGDDDPQATVVDDATTPTERSITTSPRTPTTAAPTRRDSLLQLRVRVISAILHPGTTPSGIRRRRARLSVHVAVQNPGARSVTPKRPSVLAARQRIPTNPRADAPETHLGSIDPGETADVTLRFETAGAVTEQLRTQKRARLLIGPRSWPITVKVGNPVR